MLGTPRHVCSLGKTGSERRALKTTRMTLSGLRRYWSNQPCLVRVSRNFERVLDGQSPRDQLRATTPCYA
jgi:hypothetical protein